MSTLKEHEAEGAEVVTRSAPRWAWYIIDEALSLDANTVSSHDNAWDTRVRKEISRAMDAMTETQPTKYAVTAEARAILGGKDPAPAEELFKIVERESGKTYRIFTNGRIEGFPDGYWISNRYPALLRSALCQSNAALTTSGERSSHAGAEQGSDLNGASKDAAISAALGEKK